MERLEHDEAKAPSYSPAGFFMVRAPILPIETLKPITKITDARPPAPLAMQDWLLMQRADGRQWLRKAAADTRIQSAIHVASSSQATALLKLLGNRLEGKQLDRTYSTLLRYLVRMSTRPTPHGLFAAVGLGVFGAGTSLGLGSNPVRRTRTRADAAWLLALTKQLGEDEGIRDKLRTRPNALSTRWSDRIALLHTDPDQLGSTKLISMRITAPVLLALELAASNLTYGQIVERVWEQFSNVDEAKVRGLLSQMWEMQFLLNAIAPPPTVAIAEAHLIKQLGGLNDCDSVVDQLKQLRHLADAVDAHAGHTDMAGLEDLTQHQRKMTPGFDGPTYQLDAALATTDTQLSSEIAVAAADAGGILMALGANPTFRDHLASYHHAFVERYGNATEIPLLEVLSAETGLGPPDTFAVPPRSHPLHGLPKATNPTRDQMLVRLAAEGLHRRTYEVQVTDAHLEILSGRQTDVLGAIPLPAVDVYFQIAAKSKQDIEQGRWRLILSAGMFDGLRTFGRFFDLYDGDSLAMVRDFAAAEEALHPEMVVAELNYSALGRMGNVSVRPSVRSYEVCVNASPSLPADRQIPLTDILVGTTAERFYVRSAALGKRIRITQTHALSPLQAPNLCRALIELSSDGFAPVGYFDWGPMANAPFLPRLTRGKVVLTPAQWTLTQTQLTGWTNDGTSADPDRFYAAVQSWRQEWRVPRYVYLTDFDNRLLLDLDQPLFVDELRREFRRLPKSSHSESLCVQEMLPGFDDLWLQDREGNRYHSELVVPLLPRQQPKTDGSVVRVGLARKYVAGQSNQRRWLPGQQWIHLKLYTAPTQQDDLIVGPLWQLVTELRERKLIDRSFYIRYADPLPHLRLRFHAPDAGEASSLLSRCMSWAQEVVNSALASDFSFVTYHREVERYGGPRAIEAIEEVFNANSQVAAILLRFLGHRDTDLEPEIANVVAMDSIYLSWGIEPSMRLRARHQRAVSEVARRRFRKVRPMLCELLAPGEPRPDPKAFVYAGHISRILDDQRPVIAATASQVRKLIDDGLLTAREQDIVESLVHMQTNRILGLGREREQLCEDLWLLAQRAISGRPDRLTVPGES